MANEKLEISIDLVQFDPKNPTHLRHITERTEQFTRALEQLQSLDKKLFTSAAVSAVSYLGTYIFPLVSLGMSAAFFSGYQSALRPALQQQYKAALDDLRRVYSWAMGADSGDHLKKLDLAAVQKMIDALGPHVPWAFIKTWPKNETDGIAGSGFFATKSQPAEEFENRFGTDAHTQRYAYQLYGVKGCGDIFEVGKQMMPSINISDYLHHIGDYLTRHAKPS